LRAYLVLVTVPNRRTGEKLSKGLVGNRLAACVNVVPGLRSRYRWKGKVETAREELLLIKTTQAKLKKLTDWVRKNHPYTVCETIALPITAGNPAYLRWIEKEVQ
jgi:periplasmic divalent cation tolerance protein